MKAAGFWRRFVASLIDLGLTIITLGIYFIFRIIWFCQGKPNIGMRVMGLNYDPGKGKMLMLFLFLFILTPMFYAVTIGIGWIIDIVRICMKKGTFAEMFAKNYIVKTV
ncbi:hypothetical protein SSABA_v1c08960 [Spiroplasma sabaudiense Ar-1343]|uniref:RDD domain-containing protein n=1 Tax=Spiroplasma sabaudiense Ar-1343 TaxID=1276257 RepID=W6ABT1_9MOLU|nr:RDD family protein [Spiroplasma sabaudiense]AHI54295.1 hypothetical protein SSABA_v1c08960 [Spiroplasma sabaudiense Ar-1343]